jgi:DNA-binding CsgD family transcriptional regulator
VIALHTGRGALGHEAMARLSRALVIGGIDALTPSERRVADLAAEGLSNRAIAETLFVTVKTVEMHPRPRLRQARHQGRPQLAAALDR